MSLFGSKSLDDLDEMDEMQKDETTILSDKKTCISSNVTFEGKISGSDIIEIRGHINGEICSTDTVVVDSIGVVNGPINANEIIIAGNVTGNILAHSGVKLKPTGSITGDITTPSLEVEDGGRFNGRSIMTEKEESTEFKVDDTAGETNNTDNKEEMIDEGHGE